MPRPRLCTTASSGWLPVYQNRHFHPRSSCSCEWDIDLASSDLPQATHKGWREERERKKIDNWPGTGRVRFISFYSLRLWLLFMQRFVPKSMRCKSSESYDSHTVWFDPCRRREGQKGRPKIPRERAGWRENHIDKTYLYPVFGPGVDIIAALRCGFGHFAGRFRGRTTIYKSRPGTRGRLRCPSSVFCIIIVYPGRIIRVCPLDWDIDAVVIEPSPSCRASSLSSPVRRRNYTDFQHDCLDMHVAVDAFWLQHRLDRPQSACLLLPAQDPPSERRRPCRRPASSLPWPWRDPKPVRPQVYLCRNIRMR